MNDFLSTDLYKITMAQAVWQLYPSAWVSYEFICRTKNVDLRPYASRIREKIAAMQGLAPTDEGIAFLNKQGYFHPAFLDALSHTALDPARYVTVTELPDATGGGLSITVNGPWYRTIWFEVPLLRAVNEAYFEDKASPDVWETGRKRLDAKIEQLLNLPDKGPTYHPFRLMEFGTRRAFSENWQEIVVARLAERLPSTLLAGSSNVYLAMKHNLVPQGTMAHEWIMGHQALAPLATSQKAALYAWNSVYRGKLGIALSDTVTFDQFLRDFDLALASLFTGARHDSGDPIVWAEKLIAHYEKLGLNPYTKTAAFTDGLMVEEAVALWERFGDKIRCVFGIGTSLTNDLGPDALSIVIKMTECNGVPLIKISDEPAKALCRDAAFKAWAVHLFTEVLPAQENYSLIT